MKKINLILFSILILSPMLIGFFTLQNFNLNNIIDNNNFDPNNMEKIIETDVKDDYNLETPYYSEPIQDEIHSNQVEFNVTVTSSEQAISPAISPGVQDNTTISFASNQTGTYKIEIKPQMMLITKDHSLTANSFSVKSYPAPYSSMVYSNDTYFCIYQNRSGDGIGLFLTRILYRSLAN